MNWPNKGNADLPVTINPDGYGSPCLLCPVCGEPWNHIAEVGIQEDHRIMWFQNKNTNMEDWPNPWRGTRIIIRMWGECGHEFDTEIAFHKGITYIGQRSQGDTPDWETDMGDTMPNVPGDLWRD